MHAAEHIISDLSVAHPRDALSESPVQDRWIVVPYEGEISGRMLWSPVRNSPPDVSIALPALGLCEIRVGIYASGTWPWWFNQIGRYGEIKVYNRLHLRLSDEDWFDALIPENYPETPRMTYISESLWKVADLRGQSLQLAPARKEAFLETTISVAYIRLVPVAQRETWPAETKRLIRYFDGNFWGHYVDGRADVKSLIEPLRDSDFGTVLWNTSREDTCYYPSRVGNPLPPEQMTGVYPYWMGRDMHRMLARGEDPLAVVCEVARECGLRIFGSYRRMTCRMPPFVFPIHPDAMFEKRPDLWCVDRDGSPMPHLSLAFPEVRARMVAILSEQAATYDLDGVHLYLCRGMPYVFFEPPVLEAFRGEYDVDPTQLPRLDERLGRVRSRFVTALFRELRQSLDAVGRRRGRRFAIAVHVLNRPRICLLYGIDVDALAREGLIDLLMPVHAHFLPRDMGEEWRCKPEFISEFLESTRGTSVEVSPECADKYWGNELTLPQLAEAYYAAGAHGLQINPDTPDQSGRIVERYFGHAGNLAACERRRQHAARRVRVDKVRGFRLDLEYGIQTVG